MKVCSKCKENKQTSDFYLRGDTDKYRSNCKECISINSSTKWKEDKEFKQRGQLRSKKHAVKNLYGLTVDEYNNYMSMPCGICFKYKKKMVIDHNHITGKVRGTLCGVCNSGIGMLQDNPILCRRGAEWLEKD